MAGDEHLLGIFTLRILMIANSLSIRASISIQLTIVSLLWPNFVRAENVAISLPKTVGSSIDLDMTFRREDKRKGASPVNVSSTTPVRLEVLVVEQEHTVLAWTWGKSTLNNGEALGKEALAQLEQVIATNEGMTFEIILDDRCHLVGIRNTDEVRDYAQRLFAAMNQATGKSKTESAKLLEWAKELVKGPNGLAILLPEAGTYFSVYGETLVPGETREIDCKVPNPFGGQDFPAVQRFELKTLRETDEYFRITTSKTADDEAIRRIFADSRSMLSSDGSSGRKLDLPTFAITLTGNVTINRRTSWAEQASFKATVKTDEGTQQQNYTFEKANNR